VFVYSRKRCLCLLPVREDFWNYFKTKRSLPFTKESQSRPKTWSEL